MTKLLIMFFIENQREYLILNLSHYIELSIEQNNYLTKIVNVYTVYDLDAWPKVLLRVLAMTMLEML